MEMIIGLLWLLSAVIDDSEYCYLWQLKGYRWDRMRDFFTTPQGKKYFFQLPPFLRLTFRRPKATPKAVLAIVISVLCEALLVVWTQHIAAFIVIVFLRPILFSIIISILYIPTRLWREYCIAKAKKKLRQYPNLLVIGITGSYGKTSTKEFLAHILSEKFYVVKTEANKNNDYGIAQCILNNDFSDADIFIAEMGAYRVGDIDLYCRMVRPKIGILTAINELHLSLFGSMKNTQKAKYALLRSLPKDGLAVTNADNPYCREFLHELAAPVQTFGKNPAWRPLCLIQRVEYGMDTTTAVYKLPDTTLSLRLQFPAAQYAENIAPCILVARHLGMTHDNIVRQCATLPAPAHGRVIRYGTSLVIDDSYNSNPAGFLASLELLKRVGEGKKKIVITRGMLELGYKSDELHEKVGKAVGEFVDELVVITPDFIEPMRRGMSGSHTNCIELYDYAGLGMYLKKEKENNAVILIENRIPDTLCRELYV